MQLLFPNDPLVSVPFNVGQGPNEAGPRLGGRPPANVLPRTSNEFICYFLTIPLSVEPSQEVSVFTSSNFDRLLKACGNLNEEGLVQVVVHSSSRRGKSLELSSSLSEHPLLLLEPREDWLMSDEGERIVASFHKLGGRPYFIQGKLGLEAAVRRLMAAGFAQVLQMGFPAVRGDTGEVEGDWPFGDGMFHLFGMAPFGPGDWRWFWER